MLPAIGYAVRANIRSIVDDPAIMAAEITYELADTPLRVDRYLGDCDIEQISVRAQRLSIGSPDPPSWDYMEAVHTSVVENGASAISDKLGFVRDGNQGTRIVNPSPIPWTESALEHVCRNIDVVQKFFAPFPFYIETMASPFQFRGTMSERDFLTRVFERTGCGWLLDVTSIHANSLNFGFNSFAFIESILSVPRHVQLRVTGGSWDERAEFYSPNPSRPIPNVVWDLYRHSLKLGHGRIESVFIDNEWAPSNASDGCRALQLARHIAEEIEVAV